MTIDTSKLKELHNELSKPVRVRSVEPRSKKKSTGTIETPRRGGACRRGRLTKHEIKILFRARMAMDFGRRNFSSEEVMTYTQGKDTDWPTWQRLKRQGYVANTCGGYGVKLTSKGFAKLKELGV